MKRKTLTCFCGLILQGPWACLVISQIVQVGVVTIASRGDDELNVTIALFVVTRGMWLGNVTITRRGVVNRETADDYSGGTRNSSKCKAVKYCSRNFQKKHWQEHIALCNAIEYLSNKANKKMRIPVVAPLSVT